MYMIKTKPQSNQLDWGYFMPKTAFTRNISNS